MPNSLSSGHFPQPKETADSATAGLRRNSLTTHLVRREQIS